ncbi:MAG: Gfo/Idh/MocA family oxidoreductase [Pirellulales bacterium]
MSIRLGIIGAGSIGEVHAKAALAAGQTVAGVADVNLEAATRMVAMLEETPVTGSISGSSGGASGCRAYASATQLLADDSVDAVVVCVPNRWHCEIASEAMRAGKDVLLEKPMGLNAAECQQAIEVAAQTERVLQIGMVHRHTAVGQAAKDVVEAGDLGNIYHAKAHLYRRRGVPGLGGWFTTKQISGGGPLVDIGVHVLDLACWLMDFPHIQRVSGKVYSQFGKRMQDYVYESMWAGPPKLDGVCDVEDSAHALIYFAGGGSLDLQVSWAMNWPGDSSEEENLLALFGDRGGMTFKLESDHLTVASERHGRNVDTRVMLPEIDPFVRQATSFAACVKSREMPLATGEQGRLVLSILDAIYQSSQADQDVVLDV